MLWTADLDAEQQGSDRAADAHHQMRVKSPRRPPKRGNLDQNDREASGEEEKMASLSDLTPAERAHLLGKPEGELGIAIGAVMNNTNATLIETFTSGLGFAAARA